MVIVTFATFLFCAQEESTSRAIGPTTYVHADPWAEITKPVCGVVRYMSCHGATISYVYFVYRVYIDRLRLS